jgi:hypothetical protein
MISSALAAWSDESSEPPGTIDRPASLGTYFVVSELRRAHPRSNNMTRISEELSTRIEWSPFAILGNTMPPRDPDAEEEDEDEGEEDDSADEPPVVREPDEN